MRGPELIELDQASGTLQVRFSSEAQNGAYFSFEVRIEGDVRVPGDNILVTLGYNVTGFRDPDFAAARSTERGLFAAIRVKFDEGSFGFLGLGGR